MVEIEQSPSELLGLLTEMSPLLAESNYTEARKAFEGRPMPDGVANELEMLVQTFEKADKLKDLANPNITVLRISGSSGVGKSKVSEALQEESASNQRPSVLVEEAVSDNIFLRSSVNEQDIDKRQHDLVLAQMHFMRSVWGMSLDAIEQLDQIGGGVLFVDQSDRGHKAIRAFKEETDVLGCDFLLKLNEIEIMLSDRFPRVHARDLLLVADPAELQARVIERGRDFEMGNEQYRAESLGVRQAYMLKEYGLDTEGFDSWDDIAANIQRYPDIINTTGMSKSQVTQEVKARIRPQASLLAA
jgi:deoxyadenosine/deoxycytidine kinase